MPSTSPACLPCPSMLHARAWRPHHARRVGRAHAWHALGMAGAIAGGCCGGTARLAQQHALAAPPAPAWAAPFAEIAAPFPSGVGVGPGFVAGGFGAPLIEATPAFIPAPGLSQGEIIIALENVLSGTKRHPPRRKSGGAA